MTVPPAHPFASFSISAGDYADALRLYFRRYWVTRWTPWLFTGGILLAGVLAIILSGADPFWTSIAIGGMIGAVIVPLLSYFIVLPRHARKIHAQQKTMRQKVDVSWTPESYTADTEVASSTVPWTDYYGWSADKRMILFMQSQALFQMLPRHALTDAQAAELIAILDKSGLKKI